MEMTMTPLSRRTMLRLLGAASATSLAACNSIVGSQLDTGEVGSATRNNIGVHSGEIAALTHLGERFAAQVPTTINFAFNSAALDDSARRILDQQAQFMRQFPEVRFSVYGHTDAVGSNGYNQRLGRRRAQAAVNYLAGRGISKSRLEALVSLGETQPVVPSQGRERANRRTVTRVSGFVAGDPLVLDGKYAQIVYRRYVGTGAGTATGG
jgi:outer membrane protein OmpA-like peptidoglycan-associated protein